MAGKKSKRAKVKQKFARMNKPPSETNEMTRPATVNSTTSHAARSGSSRTLVKNQQQERAKYALDEIRSLSEKTNQKGKKELKSYANAFPAMIQMNGLGQAAAFYRTKDGQHKELYKLLSEWLKKEGQPYAGKDLLTGITTGDMHQYRIAQAEALVLLDWVKKFANVYCAEKQDESNSN